MPAHRYVRSLTPVAVGVLLAFVSACVERGNAARADAEFLVTAGDSTFWVMAGDRGVVVRRAPLFLTRVDGRFVELYVADDDHSYFDAVLVGQRVYQRDLVTNDSTAVFEDPSVAAMADAWAREHPDERPLTVDQESSDEPHTIATTEAELLNAFGPYLSFAAYRDVDIVNGEDSHRSRHGVIDLTRGREATLDELLGEQSAAQVVAAGVRAHAALVDSVRASRGVVAQRAAAVIDEFVFDSTSFALVDWEGKPAIAFHVPGTGAASVGMTLPIPPVPVAEPPWWKDVSQDVPEPGAGNIERWPGDRYSVLVRYLRRGVVLMGLALDDGRQLLAGRFPAPVHRVYRLDDPAIDRVTRRALGRAFDEAALYSTDARTVARIAPPRLRDVKRIHLTSLHP
jgi:hypothetical protein